MKKYMAIAGAVIAMTLLVSCSTDSVSVNESESTKVAALAVSKEIEMPNLVGFLVTEAEQLLASKGFDGTMDAVTNPVQGKVEASPEEFLIVSQSPWAGFTIQGDSVTVTATKMQVPEQETLFLENFTVLENVLNYVGVICDENSPKSEAKLPDKAMNCNDNFVLGLWDLDDDFSRSKFEKQKENYSEPGTSGTLVGTNWTVHGEKQVLVTMQKVLGGSLLT